ncbi:BTB/POZ domain-containing protein At1g04390-like [Bidens hawaiensis]|uniref:BTB/POZ domain-containing protein At1g04390-like n=1 Tax=Bidens hawaiensis TaxID=980011 RepID=UPI00404A19F1
MRALLCSGMQESQSESIKIDLGWNALVRLVNWLYSGKLVPKPKHGCLWHNLDEQVKLEQVIPYVELYCLSDSWLLEDLHKECLEVIMNCLDSVNMATKMIQIGADCCQWDLVELAAKFMAPSYHHLRNSGQLLELDEQLVDIVRAASVARLSQ